MATVLLAGTSGFIGTSLIRSMATKRISTLSLRRKSAGGSGIDSDQACWDPYAAVPMADPEVLAGITSAVCLGGVNVAGRRWSSAYKDEILASRVKPTRAMAELVAKLQPRPKVLVCASAIGFYGDRGNELLDEQSSAGSGFLPEVCVAWEKAAQPAADAGIRVVQLRFGVVLGPGGGALAKMAPVFRAGLGGRLGDGQQWMSWISMADTVRAIEHAIDSPGLVGPVNVVAPNPITNLEFTGMLAQAVHRPALLPVPAFALRWAFGEMAEASVLASARVAPSRLLGAGFQFEFAELAGALRGLFDR